MIGPFGLLTAIPGFWSPRKVVAVLGLLLNALLTILLVAWWRG
jgi:hypothetical protein